MNAKTLRGFVGSFQAYQRSSLSSHGEGYIKAGICLVRRTPERQDLPYRKRGTNAPRCRLPSSLQLQLQFFRRPSMDGLLLFTRHGDSIFPIPEITQN